MNSSTKAKFLIVGGMKAGTSSLAETLNQHPKIFIPNKELHFFNNDENYLKGFGFYNKNFKEGFLNGEKTPTYSYQENCAERIHQYDKDIKLIWILRDPTERAISNYYHAFKLDKEKKSMLTCYINQNKNMQKNIFKGYFFRSLYSIQIKRFLKFFSINQMFFITFEEFVEHQNVILNKLCNFLNVEEYEFKKIYSNKTKFGRNRLDLFIKDLFLNNFFSQKKLRHELNIYYKDEVNQLSKLINKDLSTFWN